MSRRQDDDWQEDIYGTGGYNHSKNYPWRRGVKMSVDNPELEKPEPRDWDAYFVWKTTHLLRTLKLTHHLTPIQEKVVEEHCRLRAATVREEIESQYITKAQASKDIAEIVGKYVSLRGLVSPTWNMAGAQNELRAKQRKTAASKGYKLEGE